MNNSRERFEKFMRETRACREHSFLRDGDGYRSSAMDCAWSAWQESEFQSQSAPAKELTAEDVERQYENGIHIGSGLPRATCPCGFCMKHRYGFNQSLSWQIEPRTSFVSCECPAGVGNACTLSGSECIERSEANRKRDQAASPVDRLIDEPGGNVRAKQKIAPPPDRLQVCSMGACASFMELHGMWEMAKLVRDYLESIQGKI